MKTFLLFSGLILGSAGVALAQDADTLNWVEVSDAQALYDAIENEASQIRIISDFDTAYEESLLITNDCEIDLNGHKVVFGSHGMVAIQMSNVVMNDRSTTGDGEMTITNRFSMFILQNAGSFTIKGGTYTTTDFGTILEVGKYIDNVFIKGGRLNASARGIAVNNKGYVYMSAGTIVGGNGGYEPVANEVEGVFTLTGGAVYAGNNTSARCFYDMVWGAGDDMEVAKTILPEGVVDGGAIVLDEEWAIPDTYWINYNLPEGTQIQPNQTHYYTKGTSVNLPECNFRNYTPFAGWSANEEGGTVFMTINDENQGNYQLYPIWKYQDLPEDVRPDMIPSSISPAEGEKLPELHTFILSYGEGDYYVNDKKEDYVGLYNLLTGELVSKIESIKASWTGDITVTLAETVTANGSYELRINVASFGDDDWYYDDMEDGRCNPDLSYRYSVYNTPSGPTNCITDPQNGTTVESLSEIYFTFPDEEMALYNYDVEGIITDEEGEEVMKIDAYNIDYTELDNVLLLTLPSPIVTKGKYTLTVPEGFFSFDWWERDASALSFTWEVSGTVGVESMNQEFESKEIFDINGLRVKDNGNLRGIYIVNGKKVKF